MNNTFTSQEVNTIGYSVSRALSDFDTNNVDTDERELYEALVSLQDKLNDIFAVG